MLLNMRIDLKMISRSVEDQVKEDTKSDEHCKLDMMKLVWSETSLLPGEMRNQVRFLIED